MDGKISQLVEMGASVAQAKAALADHKDVMTAAEHIFDGKYDHVVEDDDEIPAPVASGSKTTRKEESEDDDEDEEMQDDEDEDDGEVCYAEYDSDFGDGPATARKTTDIDPYAGIFFSKDRKEEVIEIEETPEYVLLEDGETRVPLMTQGEWMRGCPEGGEQGFLFSLYQNLSSDPCPCPYQCGQVCIREKKDFFTLYPDFKQYTSHVSKLVRHVCTGCSKPYCLACGESYSQTEKARPGIGADDPLFHCGNLQGLMIGMGLAIVQMQHDSQDASSKDLQTPSSPDEPEKKKRKLGTSLKSVVPGFLSGPSEDDEAAKKKSGIGYAGNVKEDMSGQLEALASQKARDASMAELLAAVREYLPSVRRAGGGRASDFLVHPTTLAHIRRRFNVLCSTLLRNDSLSDMSDRSALYSELFSWLETISNHEALASIMGMPIMVVASVKDVVIRKSANNAGSTKERTIIYEGSSGPRELLESIVIQAEAALKGLEGIIKAREAKRDPENMTEEQKRMTNLNKGKKPLSGFDEENDKLLKFCSGILNTAAAIDRSLTEIKGNAFMDRMYKSLPRLSAASQANTSTSLDLDDKAVLKSGASEAEARAVYEQWATKARFEYCDLEVKNAHGASSSPPNYKFSYNSDARMLVNSDMPKRSLAIARELAVLTTNLPVSWNSSVFLRVDESRVDIIKALITGPDGTPYENGCYLFDIFLGASYNHTPPLVKYLTTNNGTYRFNPNLYAEGKVCLSLLGTWEGPGWISGKSTLLQVLISIQSMILCEEPYLNEPGWASQAGTPASKAYSANVRRMVVNTAMLGNLKNPPEPFEDVIRTHFRLKAKAITEQLDRWLKMDDGNATSGANNGGLSTNGGSAGAAFQQDVAELKALLRDLANEGQ
ncbi:hypothetical protein PIIN_06442 [Serendipita indica DSM 11827]|uniref:UBC core domain-containing protein n=1 Tax=Serendipita indica (strain DSM 11827) TaxID=1109443 RepID=G4TMG2_SERID|nr:hypothetical protein PIIN_06442 [Serendipita indica DSM 11827]